VPVVIIDGKVRIVTDLTEVSGTDPVTLYTCMPPYNKFILKKVLVYNRDSADHDVILGEYDTTASAWNRDILRIPVLAGQMVTLTEDDIPADFVMTTNPASAILAWACMLEAAITANPVLVKVELEVG